MRKSTLLLLLVLACSGDTRDSDYRLIADFAQRSVPLACHPADLGGTAVDRLHSATDTSLLVLDGAGGRVAEYSDRLEQVWALEYDKHGPAGVDRPVDAVLLGDTAVALVARSGPRLVILDRAGRLIHAEPLTFVPNAVTGGEEDDVLVSAMPVGARPEVLLFRYHGGELTPLDVPTRQYPDMTVKALGNATLAASLPDGSAVVVHQFFAPRGFRVIPASGSVAPLAVPTPEATRDRIDFIPRPPVTQDQFSSMLAPALAISADRDKGELYLLTRSGRSVDGRPERAILRLDRRLGYLGSYLLAVHAVHLAFLARVHALLVADDMDRFYLCPLRASTDDD